MARCLSERRRSLSPEHARRAGRLRDAGRVECADRRITAGLVEIPADSLVAGTNVLAVEVHQAAGSPDGPLWRWI